MDPAVENVTRYFMGSKLTISWKVVIFYLINNLKRVIHSIVQSLHWETGQFKYKNHAVTLRLVKHDVAYNLARSRSKFYIR